MIWLLALLVILPFIKCNDDNVYQLTSHLGPDGPFGAASCTRPLKKRDCPLFNYGPDLVTPRVLRNALETWPKWVTLYSYEIKTSGNYGKNSFRYVAKGDDVYFRRRVSHNLGTKQCEDLDATLKLTTDDCGRAKLEALPGSFPQSWLFYSQEPSTYLWEDICVSPGSNGTCEERYFDLIVRFDRVKNKQRELDITGLPFDKIAGELARIMNKSLTDPEIRFSWLGEECPLAREREENNS